MVSTKRTTANKATSARSAAKKPASARSTGTRKAPAKKAPAKKAPAKNNRKTNETESKSGRTLLLLLLLVVLIFVTVKSGENAASTAIGKIGQGILGSTASWSPALFLGLLTLGSYLANRVKDNSRRWFGIPLITMLLLLTVIEAFNISTIHEQYRVILSYVDFLKKAFDIQLGGGLLGGFIAYPLESVLGPGFTCGLLIIVEILILHFFRVINGNAIAGFLGTSAEKAGKGVATLAAGTAEKVRTAVREYKAEHEDIYDEDIDTSKKGGKVSVPVLDGEKGRVTPIKPIGDEFEIPVAGKKKGKKTETPDEDHILDFLNEQPEKPVRRSKLTEDIEKEDPAKRRDRYIKNVPESSDESKYGPHGPADPKRDAYYSRLRGDKPSAAPAPVKVPSSGMDKEVADFVRQVNETANPVKQPQQPKPSFFEEDKPAEAGKTIRQNSDQGKPSETTYVKPNLENVSAVPVSAPVSAPMSAPVKSEPKPAPAPKPEYVYPTFDLMETGGPASTNVHSVDDVDKQRALLLVETLNNFNIAVKLTGITHGPAVTRYEILPAPGIKVAKISNLADDIAMAMEAVSVRIEAPIPGKNAVGIEIPNPKTEVVHLRDILESAEAKRNNKKLMVAMGKDNNGRYIVADLASMPHVLIAGQTGSGKSVCINAFIISLLYRATPDEVKMIMIDPKMVELNVYNTIPHLLVPVVTDPKKAAGALDWAVAEMARRYKVLAEKGAKNIESYNSHLEEGEERMPQIIIIVDELADLMMSSPREVEDAICRLAQLARAAGMHLVIATQRPSVDVITGLIKANIPTRIAFTVASGVDSKTILDTVGAEKLLGRGDMLYKPQDKNKPQRMQGAWVSEDEVDSVVQMVSSSGRAEFDEEMLEHMENAAMSDAEKKDKHEEKVTHEVDDLFERAVRECVEEGQASTSMLQRRLRVGYARAGSLIDEMEQRGFISGSNGSKSRNVLITRQEVDTIFGPISADD